jgi:regulator-associated protein of mTOR
MSNNNNTIRPKGPQPILDKLVETPADAKPDREELQWLQRIEIASRKTGYQEPSQPIACLSKPYPPPEPEYQPVPQRSTSPPRPVLLRAKTSFGPMREFRRRGEEGNGKAPIKSGWGIRHGFDTQLSSEEYNHMLAEVCYAPSSTVAAPSNSFV